MLISIIIPARSAERTLPGTLRSIRAPDGHEVEVVVVDDASTDGTAAVAERAGCRVARLSTRRGPAGARNAGAEVARGEVLVLVDADTELLPNALELIMADLAADGTWAAVVGNLSDAPPDTGLLGRYKNLYIHFTHRDAGPSVAFTFTSITAVRRAAYFDVGGIPDVHPNEDRAFGLALVRRGHRILFDRRVQVHHHRGYRLREFVRMEIERAHNITALKLDALRRSGERAPEHLPQCFSTAAGLIAAAGLAALAAPITGLPAVAASGALLLGTGPALWPFLRFLAQRAGLPFALMCWPLAVFDLGLALVGAAAAVVRHGLTGRRLTSP